MHQGNFRFALFLIISLLLVFFVGCGGTPVNYSLTVEISPEDAGHVSPSSGEFSSGTSLTLEVTAEDDFEFKQWGGTHGDEVAYSEGEWKILMDGKKEIIAIFEDISIGNLDQVEKPVWDGDKITWNDVDNAQSYEVKLYRDDILVETESVDPGTEQYDFSSVILDLGAGEYTVTVQAKGDGVDFNCGPVSTPSPELVKVVLTLEVGRGIGTITPEEGTYLLNKGELVNLEASPHTELKWEFEAWKGNVKDPYSKVTTIAVESNKKVYALFTGGFAGGEGTESNPFEIENADQLNNIRGYPDKHFILTQDIDLAKFGSGEGWEPVGTNNDPFTGTLEGNGKIITSLKMDASDKNNLGLFGCLGAGAELQGIVLEEVEIHGQFVVGGLAALNQGKIKNSSVTGTIKGAEGVGGLVGKNEEDIYRSGTSGEKVVGAKNVGGLAGLNVGTIERCFSSIEVEGIAASPSNIGGLVGENTEGGYVKTSWASGTVRGSYNVGGLIGENGCQTREVRGSVLNSYAIGNVSGNSNVGGLVGSHQGSISRCYSIGEVSGTSNSGGLVGKIGTHFLTNVDLSYWDIDTSKQAESAGGEGRTTLQMTVGTSNSYITPAGEIDPDENPENSMYEDWDDDIWTFGTDSQYPRFPFILTPIDPPIIW